VIARNTSRAYEFIRRKILSSDFPPGVALNAKTLAGKIGVSRTPVRDALRQLETEGLVVIRPRLGAMVKVMLLQDFTDHCGVRLALESYAAGQSALLRTDAELAEIRDSVQAMKELLATLPTRVDLDAYQADLAKQDIRFHVAILAAAKNLLLRSEILRLHLINRVVGGTASTMFVSGRSDRAGLEARDAKTLREHSEILEAIAAKDAAAAKAAMEFHIQDIIDHSLKKMSVDEASRLNAEYGF